MRVRVLGGRPGPGLRTRSPHVRSYAIRARETAPTRHDRFTRQAKQRNATLQDHLIQVGSGHRPLRPKPNVDPLGHAPAPRPPAAASPPQNTTWRPSGIGPRTPDTTSATAAASRPRSSRHLRRRTELPALEQSHNEARSLGPGSWPTPAGSVPPESRGGAASARQWKPPNGNALRMIAAFRERGRGHPGRDRRHRPASRRRMTAAQVFPSHNDVAYLRVLVKRLGPGPERRDPTQAVPGGAGSTSWPSPVVLAPR